MSIRRTRRLFLILMMSLLALVIRMHEAHAGTAQELVAKMKAGNISDSEQVELIKSASSLSQNEQKDLAKFVRQSSVQNTFKYAFLFLAQLADAGDVASLISHLAGEYAVMAVLSPDFYDEEFYEPAFEIFVASAGDLFHQRVSRHALRLITQKFKEEDPVVVTAMKVAEKSSARFGHPEAARPFTPELRAKFFGRLKTSGYGFDCDDELNF